MPPSRPYGRGLSEEDTVGTTCSTVFHNDPAVPCGLSVSVKVFEYSETFGNHVRSYDVSLAGDDSDHDVHVVVIVADWRAVVNTFADCDAALSGPL